MQKTWGDPSRFMDKQEPRCEGENNLGIFVKLKRSYCSCIIVNSKKLFEMSLKK